MGDAQEEDQVMLITLFLKCQQSSKQNSKIGSSQVDPENRETAPCDRDIELI